MAQLIFPPTPSPGFVYNGPNGIDYTWNDTLKVWLAEKAPTPLELLYPGAVMGTPALGSTLTYLLGNADGGVRPYTFSWEWKQQSTGAVVGVTDDPVFVIPASLLNQRVYVTLTVTDAVGSIVTGNTAPYPAPPAVIEKASFPLVVINFPSQLNQSAATAWSEPTTTVSPTGCIEISNDNINFGIGSLTLNTGDILYTRWINSPACGDQLSGTITGCVESSIYKQCSALNINRVPGVFPPFTPVTGVSPGSFGTSNGVTPSGYNGPGYVTHGGLPAGVTNLEGTLDNGTTWTAIPAAGTTFVITPGQTLAVRYQGSAPVTAYSVPIRIGNGTTFATQPFSVTTGPTTFPSTVFTPAGGPNAIPFTVLIPLESLDGLATATWADGSTNLTGTGCLQFRKNGGAWTQLSTGFINGDTIDLRWNPGAGCGADPTGTTITGSFTNGAFANSYSMILDKVPNAYVFPNQTNVGKSAVITSSGIVPNGYNAPAEVLLVSATLTTVQMELNGSGTWTTIPAVSPGLSIDPGDTIAIRGTTGAVDLTDYDAEISIGGVTSTWTVTTSGPFSFVGVGWFGHILLPGV